ncbi:MAG: hypothetical protein ACFE9S_08570 [Candidatus Hermodarchaeota archaeon]
MIIEEILQLAEDAAKGEDNISNGSVGSNGFGFVFRDVEDGMDMINVSFSSKVFNVGTMRRFSQEFQSKDDPDLFTLYNDIRPDLLLIGAIKTLVPNIHMPIDDLLFIVLMFVKTSDDKVFPATLYYGKTRLAIGGWNFDLVESFGIEKESLQTKYQKYFNFNPFELTLEEQKSIGEALELALRKVPVSEFEVKFRDEIGDSLLAIKEGVPIYRRILDEEYWPIEILDDGSWRFDDMFEELIENRLKPNEREKLLTSSDIFEYETLRKDIIERHYDDLVELALQQNSRFAIQVLGHFLMLYEVKMPDEFKTLVLENSRWRDEKRNLKEKKDRINRRNNLFKFRAEILEYK